MHEPVFLWVMVAGTVIAFAGLVVGTCRSQWHDVAITMMAVGIAIVLVGIVAGIYATRYPLGGQNIGRLFYFLNAESILSSVFSFPITNAISTGSGDFCLPDRATRNGQYTNPLSPVFSLKLSSTFLNLSFPSS